MLREKQLESAGNLLKIEFINRSHDIQFTTRVYGCFSPFFWGSLRPLEDGDASSGQVWLKAKGTEYQMLSEVEQLFSEARLEGLSQVTIMDCWMKKKGNAQS